jgi:hypothetical protein
METINGLFKAECIRTTVFHAGPYKTLADVEYATAGWVDWSRYAGDPGVSDVRSRGLGGPSVQEACDFRSVSGSECKPCGRAGYLGGAPAA